MPIPSIMRSPFQSSKVMFSLVFVFLGGLTNQVLYVILNSFRSEISCPLSMLAILTPPPSQCITKRDWLHTTTIWNAWPIKTPLVLSKAVAGIRYFPPARCRIHSLRFIWQLFWQIMCQFNTRRRQTTSAKMIYSNTSAILASELNFKWAKIRERFEGYAHSPSVKFSQSALDVVLPQICGLKFFLRLCARRYCAPAYFRPIWEPKSAHYRRENTVI